jgi:hypothetical protein
MPSPYAPTRPEDQPRHRTGHVVRPFLTGRTLTRPTTQSTVTTVSGRLLAEGNDDYRPVIAILNDRWRVVECAGGVQWILQCYGGPNRWRSRYFYRTREGLILCAREHAGEIGGVALMRLLKLPKWIGGAP